MRTIPVAGLAFIASLGPAAWWQYGIGITVTGAGVSAWADQSGNGRDLKQGTDTNRPSLEVDASILFNGSDNYLKCDAFTLNQPETIYILGRQVTWTATDRIMDGNTVNSGNVAQSTSSPRITAFAGGATANSDAWVVNTYAVVAILFNGASSLIQVNSTVGTTANAGASNMGGFTLGAAGDASLFGNIQVKEVILFPTAHDAATRTRVIRYLSLVGGL